MSHSAPPPEDGPRLPWGTDVPGTRGVPTTTALRLLRIGRTVADLDRAIVFYRDALGFRPLEGSLRPAWAQLPATEGLELHAARLSLGQQEIELVAFDRCGAPYPADSNAADLWFQHLAIVTDDMPAAYERAMRHGATPITCGMPQRLPAAAGGVIAFKFRDPDGHPLELIQFPAGSGEVISQRAAPEAPTLGIDHSAISVADASSMSSQCNQPRHRRTSNCSATARRAGGRWPPRSCATSLQIAWCCRSMRWRRGSQRSRLPVCRCRDAARVPHPMPAALHCCATRMAIGWYS